MTVSSTISVFCRDGVFRTVYCHLHGEPTWNGRILHTHYAVNATMFDRYLPFSCPLNTFVTDAVRFAPFHHH